MIRVLTAADTALLVEAADLDASMRLLAALRVARLVGVTELVPAARTVLVRFDPSEVDAATLRRRLLAVSPTGSRAVDGEVVAVPVRYDGDDLDDVARELGLSVDALIERHQAATWTVAFMGFAPGFGYLVGDDPIFDVPRRPSPRTRIPAGSLALAGRFSGIYPSQSPGGWQLIGSTDARMWNLERDPPALLAPGTVVRFQQAQTGQSTSSGLDRAQPAPRSSTEASHALIVLRPGLQLLVQDLGRPGAAAQGIAASGVADRAALREANRAVGNTPGEPGLELAGGGARLRFRGPAVIALTGALADAALEGGTAQHRISAGRAVAVDDGDELRIDGVQDGLRVVLAIRGGIALAPVLGSLSTDTLAQLGPGQLLAGDELPLRGPEHGALAVERTRAPRIPLPRPGETEELEIVLGPRDDWFTQASLGTLLSQEWLVTPHADRIGMRLAGSTPLERQRQGELESEGVVAGAIQVPPDGQPVLFMRDHPLTGGYPVIGAVVDRDLDRAGQVPPGARIRFRLADPALGPDTA